VNGNNNKVRFVAWRFVRGSRKGWNYGAQSSMTDVKPLHLKQNFGAYRCCIWSSASWNWRSLVRAVAAHVELTCVS